MQASLRPAARLPWAVASAATAAAAVLGFLLLWPAPIVPVVRFSISPPEGASFIDIAIGGQTAVSPDGKVLAFVVEKPSQPQMLWVRPLDSPDARPLPGTDGAFSPFWSPDSRSLAFDSGGKLKRVELAGGPALPLADASGNSMQTPTGGWSPAGKILFPGSASSNLFLVPAAGGERSEATKLDRKLGEVSHLWPEFLPDGRHYLYHVRLANSDFQLYVGVLGSAERTLLLKGVTNAHYAPPFAGHPGYLLYTRGGVLLAQPFDARRLRLSGDAQTVAERVATTVGLTGADFSVSANGVLAYRTANFVRGEEMFWYDRSGQSAGSVLRRPEGMGNLRLSPDGRTVAFISGPPGSGQANDICLYNIDRQVTQRFTFNGRRDAVWSPDGSQVAYDQPGEGVFKRASSGAGAEETLWKDNTVFNSTDWSADGRVVLLSRREANNRRDLWFLPLAGDHKPVPLLQTLFDEFRARFAPAPGGGPPRWISYESDESGKYEIYVMPMPGGAPGKWQISSGGGVNAHWRRDGRELYYLGPDNQTIMAVDIDPGPVFHAGTPHALLTINGLRGSGAWDVAADGTKFLASVAVEASTSPIHVVLNWQEGLKKP